MTTLATQRLVLRTPRLDDAPTFALGISEFAVARWLTPLPWPCSLAMATEWLRGVSQQTPERAFFVIDLPGKGLVGAVSLRDELTVWIARPHWRRGYATEAMTALIDWHFCNSSRDMVIATSQHNNTAFLRLQQKLGFVVDGREMRYSQALQNHVDHVQARLSRADWQARGATLCA